MSHTRYENLHIFHTRLTTGYRICAAYIVFIVYCLWGAAEHRLSGAIVSCCDDDDDDDDKPPILYTEFYARRAKKHEVQNSIETM